MSAMNFKAPDAEAAWSRDCKDHAESRRGHTSIIIVTANSGLGIGDCVARALDCSADVEVIVVDNDSTDGSIETLLYRFATEIRLRIVRNAKNLGFGTACNRGAFIARGDAILFLNPDCFVETDTVARLRAIIAADHRIGLIGALQTNGRGRVDPASRRNDPLLGRALVKITGLSRWSSRPAWPPKLEIPEREHAAAVEPVGAVSGALMLLPRGVFESIGGFDEAYFLHCEDLDLCRRVRDQGMRVVCANEIRVLHGKGGSSGNRRILVAWHKHRGMWRWFLKFDPAARNSIIRGIVAIGIGASFLARLFRVGVSDATAWIGKFCQMARASCRR
jgi:N-acetylglucosaminyl-diphospho-decaprenol L-rhamnosyltransferase